MLIYQPLNNEITWMRVLHNTEAKFISGANHELTNLNLSFMAIGGYFGSYLAYIKPLMKSQATLATGLVEVYTPLGWVLACGILLGASAGHLTYSVAKAGYDALYPSPQ
ncbi:MAG: hypothetical protein JSS07_04445 [Proteobacteria bacterium]|nr:hypothetical protein [Pseudomonadota bacterium]